MVIFWNFLKSLKRLLPKIKEFSSGMECFIFSRLISLECPIIYVFFFNLPLNNLHLKELFILTGKATHQALFSEVLSGDTTASASSSQQNDRALLILPVQRCLARRCLASMKLLLSVSSFSKISFLHSLLSYFFSAQSSRDSAVATTYQSKLSCFRH